MDSPSRRRASVLFLLLVLLVFHCRRALDNSSKGFTDFINFYEASRDLYSGRDPYGSSPDRLPFVYPLVLPALLWPLANLPRDDAVAAFAAISFIAWIALVLVGAGCFQRETSGPTVLLWLPSLAAYRFVLRCNLHGQIDQILILILAWGLALLSRGRRHAGLALLALGFALKPLYGVLLAYPGLILGPAAWIEAGAWATLWMGLPALVTGPARLVPLYHSWLSNQGAHELVDPAFDVGSANQCIYATLYRWLGGPDPRGVDVFPALGVAHSPATILTLWALLAGLILGVTFWMLARRRIEPLTSGPALILATHLVFKKTWEYHLVTLVFVFTFLLARALREPDSTVRRWTRGGLVVSAILINFYSPLFVGKHVSLVLQGYGPTTCALIMLWGMSLLVATEPSPPPAAGLP